MLLYSLEMEIEVFPYRLYITYAALNASIIIHLENLLNFVLGVRLPRADHMEKSCGHCDLLVVAQNLFLNNFIMCKYLAHGSESFFLVLELKILLINAMSISLWILV